MGCLHGPGPVGAGQAPSLSMLGREQKAQLPIAAKRIQAPAYKKNRSSALGGGGWKWRVEADAVGPGRCLTAPTGPSRSPPALQAPRATVCPSSAQNDGPGAHMTPDLAAMAAPSPPLACLLVHPPIGTLSPTHETQRAQGALAAPRGHMRWCGRLGAAQGRL